MKRKLTAKEYTYVASMLFGLFFGAGNLIFPVHLGQMAGSNVWQAILGLLITGVGLPLLGVAALGISRSTGLFDLSSKVSRPYAMFFTCALYLTIGPFFAIPRCATTSFTVGLEQVLPQDGNTTIYLLLFSVAFFAAALFFALRPGKILTWVGKILTPCFLVFLAILVVVVLVTPGASVAEVAPLGGYADQPFFTGFLEGYNTMDALASLAFGIIVVQVIRDLGVEEPSAVAGSTVRAGIFSCLFMALIYIAVTLAGTQSRGVLEASENGGTALAQIAQHYLGTAGLFILAATVTLACLKTAVGLITSCAETFTALFPKGPKYRTWAVIFSLISLLLANLGLNAIIAYSLPVLMFLYPLSIALIALALVGLLIWGIVAGISAIAKGVSKPNPSESPAPSETQPAEADPNASVVTTGEVNGRPGHIITFKGNDNDIIYISDENLSGSYNIAIVDGIGTLQIEDSALIGDRYVDSDVEVTLNPVLHESGSGKETKMSPITFTVTPPDAYLEIVSPAGGADETTLSIYQVKIRVETGSSVTIDGNDVSDMITEEDNGMGSIVTNVNVEAKGENQIPITVMKKGCKSVTQNIVLTRPEMTIPIELDAATPSTVQSDTVTISGTVEAGVKVSVTSPISGEVTNNSDGSFSFVAKLSFGENDIVIVATKGEETSTLTHTVTYEPTYGEYVNKAYKMDYANLATYAGKYQPFLCSGQVVEVFQTEPYTCTFNVGTAEDPKYIYLQMVPGKPLEEGKTYKVYADVDASGTKDGYPYMIGRFFLEVAQ